MDTIKKHPLLIAGACVLALYLYNRSKGGGMGRAAGLPASQTVGRLPAGPGFVGYVDDGTVCR